MNELITVALTPQAARCLSDMFVAACELSIGNLEEAHRLACEASVRAGADGSMAEMVNVAHSLIDATKHVSP